MRQPRTTPETLRRLESIAKGSSMLLVGFIVLLIGAAAPNERLTLYGVPMSPFLFLGAAGLALLLPAAPQQVRNILWLQLPLLPLGLTLLWSADPAYGSFKFFNLLLAANLGLLFVTYAEARLGTQNLCRVLVYLLGGLLIAAASYKISHGFFDRQVHFLMSGPIVFSRLMGIGFLLCLFAFRGVAQLAGTVLFGLAVIWTLSKGPLIALLIVGAIAFLYVLDRRQKTAFLALGLVTVVVLLVWLGSLNFEPAMLGRLGVLLTIGDADFQTYGAFTSVSVRYWLADHTLSLVGGHPLGVGLGGWGSAVSDNLGHYYPHNLVLELWSEGGIFLGTLALIPFVASIFASRSPWKYLAIFLLLTQLVSGDLLDARYLLVFTAMSLFAGRADRRAPGSARCAEAQSTV